ncbi:hypothetical protein [Streptomyces sp. NPDC091209]|uniref:hypothetical protein n=1 Tax=Streptomyces sp. NPDC091209 TaxID=3365974 RepID=UPI00380A820E
MTTSTTEIPPEVLAALALPALDGLAEDKAAGRTCVWGGERLTTETAVELGEQLAPADSENVIGQRWFPRSCHRHLAERAHAGMFTHCWDCDRCDDPDGCEVGRGLYRVLREHRR